MQVKGTEWKFGLIFKSEEKKREKRKRRKKGGYGSTSTATHK